ncbi:MAG: hypothetical protein PHV18_12675 [Lachnospiraceae bacterium]|nr:hypothetical protein [Lachnospiraceae bacterium]
MPFSIMRKRRNQIKNNIVTLQVRIPASSACGKKAFPSASASMTLEAALCLSLFIFAAVSLILPMKIMATERRIQAGLEAVGEDFSRYAYLQDALESGKISTIPGADEFAKGFCRNLGAGVAKGYAQAVAMKHADTGNVQNVNALRSSIREDGETFDLILDYQIRMPFPVLGLQVIDRTARCTRRAWIGKSGKDEAGGGSGSDDDDEIVYVGRDSTRYHRNRNCHYLSNALTAVSFEEVGERRNNSGGIYHACSSCGRSAGAGSTVYIMPSGSSYHTTKECKAILAYVRAVKLSTVKHLGACSYCGR